MAGGENAYSYVSNPLTWIDPLGLNDECPCTKVGKGMGATTGTVWDSIKATQPVYKGTSIPRSFNITVDETNLWVAPNGTKHILEYITSDNKHIGTLTTPVSSQVALKEFASELNTAIKQNGLVTNKMIYGGNWEFILSAPREAGQNIVVKHARYNPTKR